MKHSSARAIPRRPILDALLCTCTLVLVPACVLAQASTISHTERAASTPTSAWRFRPGVSFGYDSFGQRYVVTDDDTLDLVDEASARLHTRIERFGRTRFELQNTFGWGQEALRNDLRLDVARPLGERFEVRLRQELRGKDYAARSDDAFASDYWLGTTRATAIWHLSGPWRLRFDERFEWAAFEPSDRYNYAYRLHEGGGEIERRYGLLSSLRLGYAFGVRSVPDSSAIDFRRHLLRAEWLHEFGRHECGVQQRVERRRYGDIATRSHFWDAITDLDARIEVRDRLRLRPAVGATWTTYDRPDSLWSDAREQAAELLVETDVSGATTLALGPRAQFRRTGAGGNAGAGDGAAGIDRAYNQWGVIGRLTFALGTTLWLQFSDEIGVREHVAGDDLLYSDYLFNWTTLYLTWQAKPQLGIDVFLSFDPELHDDDLDDTTTLLLSASLTYGWR
jgi:hypothetical protein